MFHAPWIRVVSCLVLLMAVVAGTGCGKKDPGEKVGEKMTERMLEHASGEKADVDIDGGDVTIKTGDGKVEMVATDQWPDDMFAAVPRFSHGKVERVTRNVAEGKKTFNIWLREVPDDASRKYEAELKDAGWESQLIDVGAQGSMLSSQNGALAVQFAHNKDDKTGVFIVFEGSE
jgi:hypothetical protein